MNTTLTKLGILALALAVVACSPRRVQQRPIIDNNAIVPEASAAVPAAQAADLQMRQQATRDSIAAVALATCTGDICAAISRGEVMLGMSEAQVMAATRTTPDAWTVRRVDGAAILVPRSAQLAPRDAAGQLAMVQVAAGGVRTYSYTEPHGVRVVSSPADATTAGRAAAMARALVREGDDLTAAGRFEQALNRYDRAHVLNPADAEVTYRVATTLDKMLRPQEAAIQYRLFLHQLELERIGATAEVYARMAEAMIYARERLVILERR